MSLPREEPARIPVLFIAGMGRSGSTLISRVLDQVPGAASVGELSLWDRALAENRVCGCGLVFVECPFWHAVGEHAFGGWDRVDPEEARSLRRQVERSRYIPALAGSVAPPSFKAHLERYTELSLRVYDGIARAASARVVVDSSKYPSSAYVALRTPGIDLRLVHLVRASQGVAYSWSKLVNRPDRGKPMAQFSPARAALDWNVNNTLIEGLRAFRRPHIRVRYEDFVVEPEREVRRILAVAGLDPDTPLDFLHGDEVELSTTHTVAGNPMRFRQGPERLVADDAWAHEMDPRARRLVAALTLPVRLAYGYGAKDGRVGS